MKLKSLLILLVITTVLAILSTLMLRPNTADPPKIGALLLPDLPVNAVARIHLATLEERVALVKGSDVWQVENRHGYPADFDKISTFVRQFSKLKIGRSFEGTSEALARLQLVDPAQAEADPSESGTHIQLEDADGKRIASYILGSVRSTDSGSGGQYLRRSDGNTIYLVDEGFRFLRSSPAEWLQQDLLDIKEAEIREVVSYSAGETQPLFEVRRSAKGEPAELVNAPEDQQVDPTKVEQLLGALAPLKIADLAGERQDPAPPMGDRPHLIYRLFNGQEIHIYPRKAGQDDDARFELQAIVTYQPPPDDSGSATAEKPAASSTEEAPPAQSATETDAADTEIKKAPTPEEMAALTADLSARVSGWTFLMEEWQWKSFITQVEGLLETKEEAPPQPTS
ncbi:MAG: DUF4340 domain-containing protein [Desulfosarcinaceae bacterium]|nr:DUF4340 domain-containing protein [Desulfosarcinaceae bacterium]